MFGFHLIKGFTFHRLNTLRHEKIPCRSLDTLALTVSRAVPLSPQGFSRLYDFTRDTLVFGRSCGGDVVWSDFAAS
jgi:hypothetical protein